MAEPPALTRTSTRWLTQQGAGTTFAQRSGASRPTGCEPQKSAPLSDPLTKGELREEDLVRAFRPHIASRYEVVKGVSRQCGRRRERSARPPDARQPRPAIARRSFEHE